MPSILSVGYRVESSRVGRSLAIIVALVLVAVASPLSSFAVSVPCHVLRPLSWFLGPGPGNRDCRRRPPGLPGTSPPLRLPVHPSAENPRGLVDYYYQYYCGCSSCVQCFVFQPQRYLFSDYYGTVLPLYQVRTATRKDRSKNVNVER